MKMADAARRILVVDDDRLMARTLCDILQLHGWQAGAAYSGREAVEAVRKEGYGVVLMDIRMPGLDGVAAFKAIKVDRPDVKVILMTAFAESAKMEEAQLAGAVAVMPKPLRVPSLLKLLE
jgi:CheY-like chemotaxis protein